MENTAVGVIDFDTLFNVAQEEYKEQAISKIKGYIEQFEEGIIREEMIAAKSMLENTVLLIDAILSCNDDGLNNPEAIYEAIIKKIKQTDQPLAK